MAEKPILKIGHLKITDHLILGVTKDKLLKSEESFNHCRLAPVLMNGWNQVADALTDGSLDGAFILAPTAMDLFKSGVGLKLILFAHRSGSILVKSKFAKIDKMEDFKGKVVLIPYQLSVHNILFHKLLADLGLKPGISSDPEVDVFLEVMAPGTMLDAVKYDEEGEIGGFIVAEPIGTQVITEGYGEVVCLSKDLWPGHPCCVFVMRDDTIGKYPDAVQELTNSFVQSGFAIEQDPEKASIIGAEFLGQDQAVIKNVLTDPPDRITTDKLMPTVKELEMMQDYMENQMKIIDSKIDISQFVDTQFAQIAGAK